MNPLLTPEAICELDTFTLEEKIEELDAHPQKELYAHIIQIAKLELIDRLEIQEFGRQLANDQYKIDLDFNLPSLTLQPRAPPKPSGNLQRQQIISKLPINLAPTGFLTVGKPAVSHHYKPAKPKQTEPVQKPKKFLKAKKFSTSKPKITTPKTDKQAIKRQSLSKLPEKDDRKIEREQQKVSQQDIWLKKDEVKIEEPKVEFNLREKLKKEVEEMNVVFRQNDAYDDMRAIKISPLNLKDEEEKILSEQKGPQPNRTIDTIAVNFMDKAIEQVSTKLLSDYREQIVPAKQSKVEIADVDAIEQIKEVDITPLTSVSQEESQSIHFIKQRQRQNEENVSLIKSAQNTTHQKALSQLSQCLLSADTTLREPEQRQYTYSPSVTVLQRFHQQIEAPKKEMKSKSVKSFNKKVVQNIKYDNDDCELISSKLKEEDVLVIGFPEKQDKQQKTAVIKAKKSGIEQSLKPIYQLRPALATFPYHEIIQNFNKLFPHSKNLLVTLRNVEDNLRMHFDKAVTQKSLIDEFRKVSESDLTFRVVSESEKAKKHRDLFNISLESFYERGRTMLKRIKNDLEEPEPHQILLYRVVRTKEEVYDIINSSFHRTRSWYELPHGLELKASWNLLWTWSRPQIDFQDLFLFQKVNHFLGNKQIARKDLLKKNIQKIQKLGTKIRQHFDIIPETFLLPGQNIQFIKKFRENGMKDSLNYWILKPVGLSRGRGISLINKLEDVVFSEPIVLQKYIMNPLLLDGFKFDMRIYVLVTSMNPLQAFIYKQGFARLSTEAYSVSQESMENKFVHLTNFSIQRQNLSQQKRQSLQENVGGSKISLRMLANKLKESNVQWSYVQKQIEDIILKSLIACMNAIPQNPNCFQLFGYDIFIDANLKCWLLEINSSPSLEKQYTLDQVIKQQLVDDIIEIVNPMNFDRSRLLEVVQRRRRETEGLKSSINTHSNSSQQLNEDLHYILHGAKLRKYGQGVLNNNFKMIAPSENYHRIVKILQQYKIDPIVKET